MQNYLGCAENTYSNCHDGMILSAETKAKEKASPYDKFKRKNYDDKRSIEAVGVGVESSTTYYTWKVTQVAATGAPFTFYYITKFVATT